MAAEWSGWSRDAQDKGLQHVSLEDARIRGLVQQLPRVVVTEPIPCLRFASLPAEVVGFWSLWRIALDNQSLRDVKIIPIFHHDDGRNLVPTARHIWDSLMEDRPEVEQVGTKTGGEVEAVFRRLRSEAERQGEGAFHELYARHQGAAPLHGPPAFVPPLVFLTPGCTPPAPGSRRSGGQHFQATAKRERR